MTEVLNLCNNKISLFNKSKFKFFLLSFLAGIYVSIMYVISFYVGSILNLPNPYFKIIVAIILPINLIMILFAGGELFSGNIFSFFMAIFSKKFSTKNIFNLMIFCLFSNVIGILFVNFLLKFSGIFKTIPQKNYLESIINTKLNLNFIELFFRAILCKIILSLVFWISLKVRDDITKLFVCLFLGFSFVIAGFEHSIINISIFVFGILFFGLDKFALISILTNIFIVIIGNIVGGFILSFCYFNALKED